MKSSPRDRAKINTSENIYTVDQSISGFSVEKWVLRCNNPNIYYYWIRSVDEITMFVEYRNILGCKVFSEAKKDIEKYGSWLGYRI